MDAPTLTEALRMLDENAFTWKLALYGTQKSRDGVELEWNLCNMKGIEVFAGRLREYLLKKQTGEKPVVPYSPFLPERENVGAMERSCELIRDQLSDALMNIRNGRACAPEDYTTGTLPKVTGYAFYGEKPGENGLPAEEVLFLRRTNPFLTGGSAYLCIGDGDEIVRCDQPVLKFAIAVDFLLIGDVCYFFSSGIEKDFALENRHIAIAQKRMATISEAGIINGYDQLEAAAMKIKNAKKFLDFDQRILEHIIRLPIREREEYLLTYGITVDSSGLVDTSDADQCDLIVDLLCCRSCLDPLGRLSVGENITPRE